jgi:hypothetical protein
MKSLIAGLLLVAALPPAQTKQTFTGVVTDSTCGRDGHAGMRMGPTDAECTRLCVAAHGSAYVLYDGNDIYMLSDQQAPDAFAGEEVRVVGTLDAKTKTIQVESITSAK